MDPVGPWSAYASYNRLAGVQAGAAGGDFHHHLGGSGAGLAGHAAAAGGVPSTTSQLLLQAAHTTASLAGQLGSSSASPFNPGGFLSPPPVGYDAVFSPLFHHANPKPAHYSSTINAQHRLAQAQAAASKQSSVESELSTLRENYSTHHQTLTAAQGSTFFDQSSAPAGASSLAWQGNNQLPSPFGILPHESVVPSSPSPATTKSSSSATYENFNAHFAAAQSINHLNNTLVATANKARAASPQVTPPVKPVASTAGASFFQTPTTFGSSTENISSYSGTNAKSGQISAQQDYTAGGKQRANASGQTSVGSGQQGGSQDGVSKVPDKKITVPSTGAGSGFMASYLKFLQGERDTSPPPATRGGRKATWSRSNTTPTTTTTAGSTNKPFNDQTNSKPEQNPQALQQNANGTMTSPNVMSSGVTMGATGVLASVGATGSPGTMALPGAQPLAQSNVISNPPSIAKPIEHQDDSRYYSASKDRKRKFDGTDDGFDVNDEEARRLNKPVLNVPSTPLNEKGKKGRSAVNSSGGGGGGGTNNSNSSKAPVGAVAAKKRPGVGAAPLPGMQPQPQQYYYQQPDEASDPLLLPERRELSHRKAKERNNLAQLLHHQPVAEDDPDELPDFHDSDSDPAWTKEDEEVSGAGGSRNKRLKRSRPVGAGTRASNILSVAAHGAGIDYADYSSEEETGANKKLNQQRTIQHTTPIIQQTVNARPEEMPYQSGEFVAIKSELSEAWPAIWRVDGKTLLQKYEPFDQNGKVLYKNISTYAAWNPENKKLYVQVPVRVRAQNHLETIVELVRSEVATDDSEFIEKRMQDTIVYQDNFEVYIQTLISHALDPNFLMEIFQEQDEYFLTNVKTVDDITEERRRVLSLSAGWSRTLEVSLATWPCLGLSELGGGTPALCVACRQQRANNRMQLYGQPYNSATLEPCQPDPRMPYEKEAAVCRACAHRAELYSHISHQKYLMFVECNKRVAEKRLQDPNKDTTLILNELLADEQWLSQLFRDVRQSWAEAESMERKSRQGMSRQHM